MTSQDHESVADRYLEKATDIVAGHRGLAVEELEWLLDHTTRLNGLRFELLRALQAALPGHRANQQIADFKEILTDLIIMQSRSSGREEALRQRLGQAVESLGEAVPVAEAELRAGLLEALAVCEHIRSVGGQ